MKLRKIFLSFLVVVLCSCGGSQKYTNKQYHELLEKTGDYICETISEDNKNVKQRKTPKEELKEIDDYSTISSVAAIIYLLSSICELEECPEDKIVSALVIELQEVDVYIVFDKNADIENNKLYIEAMCLMNNSIEIDGSYLLSFEIDYNFENNEFSDFTIKQIPFNTDYIMGNYYYTDGVMYCLNYSEDEFYASELTSMIENRTNVINKYNEGVVTLERNCVDLYDAAMNRAFGEN